MIERIHPESVGLFRELVSEQRIKEYFKVLRAHNSETYAHSLRVGLLSLDMGYDNPIDDESLRYLGYGAILHDSGKLGIPKGILTKEAELSGEERNIMNMHARLGFLELGDMEYEQVRAIVVSHHEYKISPYPRSGNDRRSIRRGEDRRQSNETIKVLAQIVAVSDIYDALARRRPYKEQLELPQIESVLRGQFTGDGKYIDQVLERHPISS